MQNDYRELIHTLNRRYQEQFDRAERLEAELRHIKRSRLWRLVSFLRRRPQPSVPELQAFSSVALQPGPVAEGRVSIIIPFRDRLELLTNCLRSLKQTKHSNYEVVLIDNGSREVFSIDDPSQRILHCDEPFNFSRLCNLGAASATGEFLLFLNNDVEVLAPDWLNDMLRLLADPQVGIVGATLLYPDRTIQHAGIFSLTNGAWTHPHRGQGADLPGENGELLQPRTVPAVTGACLLIRRALFEELGGFDETLPVTMNDVNLCQRVVQRGLHVAISPTARLLHFESLSRGYSAML